MCYFPHLSILNFSQNYELPRRKANLSQLCALIPIYHSLISANYKHMFACDRFSHKAMHKTVLHGEKIVEEGWTSGIRAGGGINALLSDLFY
jgi:hypothetical protein